VASLADFEMLKDVIQKLDIRRRQVYVEVAIIEMGLAKQRELGFEFQATNMNQLDNSKVTAVGGTNFGNIGNVTANGPAGLAPLNGLTVAAVKGTFTFKGVEFLNVGALLHALQTDGDVNVLSTPNILTTDNQKAEIMVGENVPLVASQTQSAATGGNPTYNIERKDLGITLQLTPQITSDDNVRLEVKQEISAVIATAGLNPNLTTVVVKDRQTMVIGGLIRDNVVSSTSKVPLLGDIPILGWLFKFKTTKVEKTNLMIFITPYIIKTEADAGDLTNRKNDTLDQFRKEYRIEKKGAQPAGKTGAAEKPAVESPSKPDQSTEKAAPEEKKSAPSVPAQPEVKSEVPKEGAR
jgi:general secretion pathway protein D